jgi:hypothetical protein
MQPLDNGPFNTLKVAYRKKLKKFNFNNDARFVDKINFIRAYQNARNNELTEKNIQAAFQTTRNWPISRRKALMHPKIQKKDEKASPERQLDPGIDHNPKVTPKTSRQVRDYGKGKTPTTRRYCNAIAKGYANLEFELATKNDKIAALEAEVVRLTKTRKRKAIPNPNKRFMLLSEALASNAPIPADGNAIEDAGVEENVIEEVEDDENDNEEEYEIELPVRRTRSGRPIKKPHN